MHVRNPGKLVIPGGRVTGTNLDVVLLQDAICLWRTRMDFGSRRAHLPDTASRRPGRERRKRAVQEGTPARSEHETNHSRTPPLALPHGRSQPRLTVHCISSRTNAKPSFCTISTLSECHTLAHIRAGRTSAHRWKPKWSRYSERRHFI